MSNLKMSFRARKPVPAAPMELKGRMNLKSSAYCPTGGKLCDQYMYVDQMNAHYKKVLTAKSAIDNKVPKSHVSSTLARDRKSKDAIQKGGRPPPSRSSMRHMGGSQENLLSGSPSLRGSRTNMAWGDTAQEDKQRMPEDEDMALVDAIINDTINSPRSYRSGRDGEQESMGWAKRVTITTRKPPTPRRQSADILDKRGHKFTEPEKPFTPRTLKKDQVTSRLSQLKKFYRPPPSKKVSESRPSDENGPNSVSVHNDQDIVTENGSIFDETLMSRDFNRLKKTGTVPALDISLDTDNLKWMKEQSSKMSDREGRPNRDRNLNTTKKLQKDFMKQSMYEEDEGKLDTYRWVQSNGYSDRDALRKTDTFRASSIAGFNKSMTMQRVEDEEEELKYLEFVTEVTNDVLNRGIFTNRVLKVVFKQHMDKHKNDLSESRMRALLDTLREDLGIPKDDGDIDTNDDVGMTTTKSYQKKKKDYERSMENAWSSSIRERVPAYQSKEMSLYADELADSSSTAKLDSLVRQELLEDTNQNYKQDKYGLSQNGRLENIEEVSSLEKYSEKGSVKSRRNSRLEELEIGDLHSEKGSVKSKASVKSIKSVKSVKVDDGPSIVQKTMTENSLESPRPTPRKRKSKSVIEVERNMSDLKIDDLDSTAAEAMENIKGDGYAVSNKVTVGEDARKTGEDNLVNVGAIGGAAMSDSDLDVSLGKDRGDNAAVVSRSAVSNASRSDFMEDLDAVGGKGEGGSSMKGNDDYSDDHDDDREDDDEKSERTGRRGKNITRQSARELDSEDEVSERRQGSQLRKSLDLDSGDEEVANITSHGKHSDVDDNDDDGLTTARTEDDYDDDFSNDGDDGEDGVGDESSRSTMKKVVRTVEESAELSDDDF